METRLTRRSLLKLSGGILVAASSVRNTRPVVAQSDEPVIQPARRPFGRAIQSVIVREQPSVKARQVRMLKANEVVEVLGQTTGEGPTTYNTIWYQISDGFVHSAFMQPCENSLNQAVERLDEGGFWGELTVPVSEARARPDPKAYLRYRYYYGTVYKVLAVVAGKDGVPWYRISDEYAGDGFYVRAEHIRPIRPDEFASISPDVPPEAKKIEVDLARQVTTAFEYDKPVFSARVATGASFGGVGYRTIPGSHRIFRKLPSQHMVGGSGSSYYDLPGIGWVSYFTASGIAFHGTYWHNDYGRPRSHGCVNMLPEDAKWVFRWTMPVPKYEDRRTVTARREDGSLVRVF